MISFVELFQKPNLLLVDEREDSAAGTYSATERCDSNGFSRAIREQDGG